MTLSREGLLGLPSQEGGGRQEEHKGVNGSWSLRSPPTQKNMDRNGQRSGHIPRRNAERHTHRSRVCEKRSVGRRPEAETHANE